MRVVSFAILTIAIALGSSAGAVDVFISAEESPPTPEPSSEPWIEPWQQNDAWEKFRTPWRYPAEKDSDDESYFRPEPSPEYYEPMETAEPSEEPFFPNNSAYKPTIVEPKTPDTYNFEIKFVHSLKGFTKYLDSAIKKSSAEFTNSSVTDWSLVEYRLVNDSKSTPRSHNSTSGTPQTWVAVYRAKLKEWPAKKYSNYVNSGKLGEDLSSTRQLNSSGLIETSLLRRTVQDEETNIQTNAGPIEEKPKEETKKKSGPGFGWQIGTGVGLLALVAASAMGAYFFGVHRKGQERKRRINESFPTLSRTHSGTPSALDEQRTTSMRPPPRGADVLRGTAGIRSWQENAAQKANPAPAVGSGSLGSGSLEGQVPPRAYLPRDISQGTTSSEFAPHTSHTSSTAYVGDTLTTLSDEGRTRYSSIVESDIRTSDASTAHRVGNSTVSTLTGQIPEEELTFVNFNQGLGGNGPNSIR